MSYWRHFQVGGRHGLAQRSNFATAGGTVLLAAIKPSSREGFGGRVGLSQWQHSASQPVPNIGMFVPNMGIIKRT